MDILSKCYGQITWQTCATAAVKKHSHYPLFNYSLSLGEDSNK